MDNTHWTSTAVCFSRSFWRLETHSDHLHEGTAIPHILPISSNRILNTNATSYSSNK